MKITIKIGIHITYQNLMKRKINIEMSGKDELSSSTFSMVQ